MAAVGLKLRSLRGEVGLTAQQVADRAGWSRSYVSQVEGGRITPSEAFVRACERVLSLPPGGLDREDLFDGSQLDELLELANNFASDANGAEEGTPSPYPSALRLTSDAAVRECMRSMLRSAPPTAISSRTITLTSLREQEQARSLSETRVVDRDLVGWLRDALTRGWGIRHLLKSPGGVLSNPGDAFEIVALMACRGAYTAVTIAPAASAMTSPARDFLDVPGVGILLIESGRGSFVSTRDVAYLPFSEDLKRLQHGSRVLMRRYRHASEENLARELRVTAAECEPGDLRLVSDRLSVHARPVSLHEMQQQTRGRSDVWLEHRVARIEAFELDLQRHSYRQILSRSGLDGYFSDGYYATDLDRDYRRRQGHDVAAPLRVPVSERLAILERMIWLLNSFENFEVLLDAASGQSAITNNAWELKSCPGEDVVFLFAHATRSASNDLSQAANQSIDDGLSTSIEIREPSLTRLFRDRFDAVWRTIGIGTNKRETVSWLTRKVEDLATVGAE